MARSVLVNGAGNGGRLAQLSDYRYEMGRLPFFFMDARFFLVLLPNARLRCAKAEQQILLRWRFLLAK